MMAHILMHPTRYNAAGLAIGPRANVTLRGWAGLQLARAYIASGEIDDAAGALDRLSRVAERAPGSLSRKISRDLDALASQIGHSTIGRRA
jgi:hypothetical protein